MNNLTDRIRAIMLAFGSLCCLWSYTASSWSATPSLLDQKWVAYPTEAKPFNFTKASLKQSWAVLMRDEHYPWPDQQYLKTRFSKLEAIQILYKIAAKQPLSKPRSKLPKELANLVKLYRKGKFAPNLVPAKYKNVYTYLTKDGINPAVTQILNGNFTAMADAVQDAWVEYFNGNYQGAFEQGMHLGPLGLDPAMLAAANHVYFLVDERHKAKSYLPLITEMEVFNEIDQKNFYANFLLLYTRLRYLESLHAVDAEATGWIKPSLATMEELISQKPNHFDLIAMKAGFYSAIIGKAGNYLAELWYKIEDPEAQKNFNVTLQRHPELAQTAYEYSRGLVALDYFKYRSEIKSRLLQCATINTISAYEELNRLNCSALKKELFK